MPFSLNAYPEIIDCEILIDEEFVFHRQLSILTINDPHSLRAYIANNLLGHTDIDGYWCADVYNMLDGETLAAIESSF